jgi:hypothetical protein
VKRKESKSFGGNGNKSKVVSESGTQKCDVCYHHTDENRSVTSDHITAGFEKKHKEHEMSSKLSGWSHTTIAFYQSYHHPKVANLVGWKLALLNDLQQYVENCRLACVD